MKKELNKIVSIIRRKTLLREYLQIGFGIILCSIGLKAFLIPNGFLDGGVTGIALLLKTLFAVETSVSLILITIPFLFLAFFYLSKKVAVKSLISIIILALFLHFENFEIITDDKLLISIFGGLFVGLGIGLTIKNGAVLDGSEIVGILLNQKLGLSIGTVILFFNVILFGVTAILVSVEVAMYSILTFIVTAKVVDFVIKGFEDFIGLMIVSDKNDLIQEQIIKNHGAGFTTYTSANTYGKNGRKTNQLVIHTMINRIDLHKMNKLIETVDINAFVVEYDVNKVSGGILRRYLK